VTVSPELLAAAVAVASLRGHGATAKARAIFREGGVALRGFYDALTADARNEADAVADTLIRRGVGCLTLSDTRYPHQLLTMRNPPPFLFTWGNLDLLNTRGVGMCGSRAASGRGLEYARTFGREVAARGLQVISGYARGVDMETHLGALEAGGSTVVVLAEGITHFRIKRDFRSVPFEENRVLVLSQFAPGQPWTAGAAMTRNGIIAGLGQALLVVEAGARGGTLNAGQQALSLGRPVFAIDYRDDPPEGNQLLIDKGARPLRSRNELLQMLDDVARNQGAAVQLSL
jgi:DNA processing protein